MTAFCHIDQFFKLEKCHPPDGCSSASKPRADSYTGACACRWAPERGATCCGQALPARAAAERRTRDFGCKVISSAGEPARRSGIREPGPSHSLLDESKA